MFKFLILFLLMGNAFAEYPFLDLGGITTNAGNIASNLVEIQSNDTDIASNLVEIQSNEVRITAEENLSVDLNTRGALIATDGSNNVQFDPCADGEIIVWNGDAPLGFECQIAASGGGGGGSNFNNAFTLNQVNNNAEQGLLGWVDNGGIFSLETTDPLEGQSSFTWIPAAVGDFVDSPEMNFTRNVLLGNDCQVQTTYIGADENIELQVINGNDEVLASETLDALPIGSFRDFYFRCPRASILDGTATPAEILLDVRSRNLRLRYINSGPVVAQPITFDKQYIGTNFNVSTVTLPDVFSISVDQATRATNSQTGDVFVSCSKSGSLNSITTCLTNGLTILPACTAIVSELGPDPAGLEVTYDRFASTPSSLVFQTTGGTNTGRFAEDRGLDIICHKQGVDAQQEARVFTAQPRVINNSNEFGAIISGATENDICNTATCNIIRPDPIGSFDSATRLSLATYELNYTSQGLTSPPRCHGLSKTNSMPLRVLSVSNTSIVVIHAVNASGGGFADAAFNITCEKTGSDRVQVKTNIFLIGQVRTNSNESLIVKHCTFFDGLANQSNTAQTLARNCNSWVKTFTLAVGGASANIELVEGVFGSDGRDISCTFNRNLENNNVITNVAGGTGIFQEVTATNIVFAFYNQNGNIFFDSGFLQCIGSL